MCLFHTRNLWWCRGNSHGGGKRIFRRTDFLPSLDPNIHLSKMYPMSSLRYDHFCCFFFFFAQAEYNALPRAGVILVSGRALIFIRVRHLLAREGVCGNLNSSPGLKLASTLNDRSYNNFRVSIADMHSRLLLALRSISWSKKRVLMAQRFIAFLY